MIVILVIYEQNINASLCGLTFRNSHRFSVSLNQIYFDTGDNSVKSKVNRMLRYFRNDEEKESIIRDLRDSIERLEMAQTLIPIYKKTLERVELL